MTANEVRQRIEAVLDRLEMEGRTVFAWSYVKEELERIKTEK